MIFISLTLQQMAASPAAGMGSSSDVLTLLLDIAVTREDQLKSANMEPVLKLARDAIGDTLRIMTAKDFVLGLVKVLESEQTMVDRLGFFSGSMC